MMNNIKMIYRIKIFGGNYMVKISEKDFESIKNILGRLFEENGLEDEVILLSKVVDKIIVEKQIMKVKKSKYLGDR